MPKVIIIVNAQVNAGKISPTSPVTEKMAMALRNSIISCNQNNEVEIIGGAQLWSKSFNKLNSQEDIIYCPLTIKLPDWFNFPAQHIYSACRDLDKRRKWVNQHFGYKTTTDNLWLGNLWLPIIFTGDNIIYREIISEGIIPNSYQQPYECPSHIYPLLQTLSYGLLQSIHAIPSVYLLQFTILDDNLIFDRIWPFPATPAIASIHQKPDDLFNAHWHCLNPH
ncbi:hypothetical protein ACN4EE_05310 [Geminocystis sp. CENA526]|uniref:hypothetical protein n=1 Tax=Geminocystis sp. CENA526 TaxID=1355871 RepID=UPI003D6E531A